jgi:hypothetical protein
MKTKKYIMLLFSAIVFIYGINVFGITPQEKLKADKLRISTLKGLKGIKPVVLLAAGNGVNLHSLTQEGLQGELELKFRHAGIPIVDDGNDIQNGTYRIIFYVIKTDNFPIYSINVEAGLSQWITLYREPKVRMYGRTWPVYSSPEAYIGGETKIEETIRTLFTSKTNEFIGDYSIANLKQLKPDTFR